MESASLRPVPLRPPGPVAPEGALRCVAETLPALDEEACRALGLVELAGRPRGDVAAELGLSAEAIAAVLSRARKALRRSMFPLSASGWCERAERLISDRLDGELAGPGRARLDAHLENCDRCVEHERRLGQARETLVRRFMELHPASEPEREPAASPELRVVEPAPAPRPAKRTLYALALLSAVLSAIVAVLAATGVIERAL